MEHQEPQEADATKCKLVVQFSSNTPVFGCRLQPICRVSKFNDSIDVPPHNLIFTWYREQVSSSLDREKVRCSIHLDKYATVQCMSCVTLNLSVKGSYHCSPSCLVDAWKKHKVRHHYAAEIISETVTDNQQEVKNIGNYVSWPDFVDDSSPDESAMVVERDGKSWIKVGTSTAYMPTEYDIGFSLRLECVVVDSSMNTHLCPIDVTVTDPVVYPPAHPPRSMIKCVWKSWDSDLKAQSSKDVTVSVLTYNILAGLYVYNKHPYCPGWALSWEYRLQNVLNEIIEYDPDILCLQEVQRDHFESFLKPELAKCGYSVLYKHKTKEMYTANQYTTDGCATCYRRDLFKEIVKYELEFDKSARPFVEGLEPELRNQGSYRLIKGNIALIVILEKVESEGSCDGKRARICVSNTHIHASEKFPDTKLFQVVNLINGLEKIAQSKIPLLICADLNSLPLSDAHRLVSKGRLDSVPSKENDPLAVFQHLRLRHSMPLTSAYACFCQSDGIEEQQLRKMDSESKEPILTNFTPEFAGTLDYIFYTANSLRLESVLELFDKEALTPGLPSPYWSSDHIALMGSFALEPSSYQDYCSQPIPPNPWQQAAAAK